MKNVGNAVMNVLTIGAIGAATGLAFASMSPTQQKRVEKNIKKSVDKLTDIVDTMSDTVETKVEKMM